MARSDLNKPTPGAVRHVTFQVSHGFGDFSRTDAWSPPINVYRLADRLEVCVDLAGVDRRAMDVHVQPGSLSIRGSRSAPQPAPPTDQQAKAGGMHIHCMEIDHGPFRRVIDIPEYVDLDRVESEYIDGLLWVRLPFRT